MPSCECGGCRCGVSTKYAEMDAFMKTMQFLMGLNEGFEVSKNQILMQDPLPSANRVYAMLQSVESQKTICKTFDENLEATTMAVKAQMGRKSLINKNGFKKKDIERKE